MTTEMNAPEFVFQDPDRPLEERVADLVARMTLEEKASQMLYTSPAIPRLGIPEYNWWNECLHGVARNGRATVFPQAIGLAATFDVDLLHRVASAISDEARAKHHAAVRLGNRGQYAGLTFWTPNINIFRDPRWGRGQETYGEDPYLTGEMGAAFVRGLQGDHPAYLKTAACAKHFAVHSGPEKDRHHFDAIASPKDLWETYLPAFKKLVEAGVESVMGAYNRTNGEPCCGSKTLLVDILRRKWGFAGHVVSDCWAVEDFHMNHKITSGPVESVALAVNNGCDLCCGDVYAHLVEAVRAGLIAEETIDASVTRLLRTRFKLGMFDPPERVPFTAIPTDVVDSAAHRRLAREAAAKAIVLLKNDKALLPLDARYKRLRIVGPNAASTEMLMGNYYGMSTPMITVLEGIVGRVPEGTTVDYRHDCLLDRESIQSTALAINVTNDESVGGTDDVTRTENLTIAVMGINGLIEGEEGDAVASVARGDRNDIALPPHQVDYLRRIRRAGGPLVVVLAAGSALAFPEVAEIADAILYVWYPGAEGGNAVADVLFGAVAPSGRLPITIPKGTEQLPPYEDYAMAGRTYRYLTEEPLYPFGFGLSYTRFAYGPLGIGKDVLPAGEPLPLAVTVTNAGDVAADEVVQVYLSDREASVEVPRHKLIGFRRIHLAPGASARLEFVITPEQMSLVDRDGNLVLEPGEFEVLVGGASPGKRSRDLGAPEMASALFFVAEPGASG